MRIRIYKARCSFCWHQESFRLDVDSFNKLGKLQQHYRCKKCGYCDIKGRRIDPKTAVFSFFMLVLFRSDFLYFWRCSKIIIIIPIKIMILFGCFCYHILVEFKLVLRLWRQLLSVLCFR